MRNRLQLQGRMLPTRNHDRKDSLAKSSAGLRPSRPEPGAPDAPRSPHATNSARAAHRERAARVWAQIQSLGDLTELWEISQKCVPRRPVKPLITHRMSYPARIHIARSLILATGKRHIKTGLPTPCPHSYPLTSPK